MLTALRRSAACSRQLVRPAGLSPALRRFSDDSHEDFEPKKKAAAEGLDEVLGVIEKQVKEHPVMLYMKGTPAQPMCGFSMQVVRILHATGVDFDSVNVLNFPAIREGIKVYSDWPTIPQLYVKGEFVGGCDIVTQMFKAGDLENLFRQHKLIQDDPAKP